MAKLSIDGSQADATIDSVAAREKEIENMKGKVALDTSEAESKLSGLKEKAKDAVGGLGAGLLVGGAAVGVDKLLDSYKELAKSNSDLKIAIAGTGQSQAQQQEIFKQSQEEVDTLSQKYHVHEEAVRSVETAIVGIGGVTGAAKGKLTEIGLAFEQLNIPAKALKGVIAGANDPDSQQALDALQKKIGNLGPAFTNATTPAEKMDAIYARLKGTLGGMANLDPQLAAMEQMDETTKKMEESGGQLIVGFLSPVVPLLTGLASVMTGVVVPAISSVSDFIQNNKAGVAVLAVGVGILTLALNANAIATTGVTIAEKARAVATGVVTGAQWLLNAAMTANPGLLLLGAVVALAAGAVLLYNNVKPVHDVFDQVWIVLKALGSFIGAFVTNEVKALAEGFKGVGNVIDGIIHLNFDEVKQGVAQVGTAIGDHVTAGASAMGAFRKSVADGTKALADQKGGAKDAGDQSVDSAQQAAKAQADFEVAIKGANDAFTAQGAAAKAALDDAKTTYERQAEYVATGYANGQKLSADQIAAYAAANVKLKASAKDTQEELKRIAKEGKEFDGTDKKPKTAKTGNLLADATMRAEEAAKELEAKLKLQDAQKGIAFTSTDELAVEKEKISVFNAQVESLKLMTAEKGKFKQKATLKQDENSTGELTLEAKIKIDTQKLKDDFNKSAEELTKKKIEIGILPKDEGIKVIGNEIDEIQKNLTVLRAQAIINPTDVATATKVNAAETQLIDLQKQRHDLGIQQEEDLAAAKIANIRNVSQRAIAELDLQFQKETQFVRDAATYGRDLTATELEQKKALETKYYADLKQLQADANKQGQFLAQSGLSMFQSVLTAELNAKRSFDALAYADKKLSLDKEQTALAASLQKGQISQQEYNLKLQELTQKRTDLEKSQVQARWQTEADLAKQAYGSMSSDLSKYIQQEITMYAMQALGNTKAADTAKQNADQTMISALANTIQGFTGTIPIVGPVLGLAAGVALMEGFKALEGAIGFSTGGLGITGENGPEIIGPTKDFSQMASQLVTSTAQAVSRSMNRPQGNQRGGSQQFNVRVTGKGKTAGRDIVTTFTNESMAQRNEQLLPA